MAFGHDDRRQRARVGLGIAAQDLEAPGGDGGTRRLGMASVARKDRVEPFLQQHVAGFAEAVEQVGGGRVGKPAVGIGRQHLVPVPECLHHIRRLGGFDRLLAHRVEGEAGRQHQALLRTCHRDVDAPGVVAIVDRSQRGNRIDQEESRVLGRVDGLTNGRNVAHHARGSLVVDDADRLDGVPGVFLQALLDGFGIGRLAPITAHEF